MTSGEAPPPLGPVHDGVLLNPLSDRRSWIQCVCDRHGTRDTECRGSWLASTCLLAAPCSLTRCPSPS